MGKLQCTSETLPFWNCFLQLQKLVFRMTTNFIKSISFVLLLFAMNQPLILNCAQVRTVHENLRKTTKKLVLMQCTSVYPTHPADVNLRVSKHIDAIFLDCLHMCWRSHFCDFHVQVLETYRSEFPQTVLGYSGHELGDHYVFVPSFKIMFANGFFNLCQNLQNAYEMFKPRCGYHLGGH